MKCQLCSEDAKKLYPIQTTVGSEKTRDVCRSCSLRAGFPVDSKINNLNEKQEVNQKMNETNKQTEETKTETTQVETEANWLDEELKQLDSQVPFDGEKKPALQLEENKIAAFTVDASKPWQKYDDKVNKAVKAIIPCKREEVECIWWLNVKNPIYKDIVRKCREGVTSFKVMQTGSGASTKYNLVEE